MDKPSSLPCRPPHLDATFRSHPIRPTLTLNIARTHLVLPLVRSSTSAVTRMRMRPTKFARSRHPPIVPRMTCVMCLLLLLQPITRVPRHSPLARIIHLGQRRSMLLQVEHKHESKCTMCIIIMRRRHKYRRLLPLPVVPMPPPHIIRIHIHMHKRIVDRLRIRSKQLPLSHSHSVHALHLIVCRRRPHHAIHHRVQHISRINGNPRTPRVTRIGSHRYPHRSIFSRLDVA